MLTSVPASPGQTASQGGWGGGIWSQPMTAGPHWLWFAFRRESMPRGLPNGQDSHRFGPQPLPLQTTGAERGPGSLQNTFSFSAAPVQGPPPGVSPRGVLFLYKTLGLTKLRSCMNGLCCRCSVTKSCPTLCDPMDSSTPGFPVLHYLPEFAQTHGHWVHDAIQPSHPLSPPSPPALNFSQHQGLFQWVSSSH